LSVECVIESRNVIGEAPWWSVEEGKLYWVDIMAPALHRMDPNGTQPDKWTLPSEIGSFALRRAGGAVVALRDGFAFLDLETGAVEPIADPESDRPTNRFNDGKCDRQGRFWAGTMDDLGGPNGALYRLDADLSWHEMRGNATISNGLGWSPDDRTMYYSDSGVPLMYAFDFDRDSGTISGERVFARPEGGMAADGLTVDSEGCIWTPQWDGGCVIRYTPDGRIDRRIDLPVQRPTSCVFGGSGLDQLFVTSAAIRLSAEEGPAGALDGAVFVIDAGVAGLPEPRFAG
jgi:L-arabinonolactonase